MADDRKAGWEPWSPERERGGSGVGAFTGKDPPGDRSLEGRKREGASGPGDGPAQPEFPPEGWGEEGENYPPTQGPLGEPGDKAQD
jgi:hypothetical protein